MALPSRPWVEPKKFAYKDINNAGQIVIDAATSPFTGRLDNIFVSNQTNNPIVFHLTCISESVSTPRIMVTLAPNEQRGVWDGEIEYIMPDDIYFAYTDAPTNLVTCTVNYIIYNELLPTPA